MFVKSFKQFLSEGLLDNIVKEINNKKYSDDSLKIKSESTSKDELVVYYNSGKEDMDGDLDRLQGLFANGGKLFKYFINKYSIKLSVVDSGRDERSDIFVNKEDADKPEYHVWVKLNAVLAKNVKS